MIIFKYDVTNSFTLDLPQGSTFLKAGTQNGEMRMWVLLDSKAEKKPTHFRLVPTGVEFNSDGLDFLSTIKKGVFIYHLFEVKE